MQAMQAITQGEPIVIEVDDLELRVVLEGDPKLVETFKASMNLALMQALPTPRSIN
jgi:hypothetical protein